MLTERDIDPIPYHEHEVADISRSSAGAETQSVHQLHNELHSGAISGLVAFIQGIIDGFFDRV